MSARLPLSFVSNAYNMVGLDMCMVFSKCHDIGGGYCKVLSGFDIKQTSDSLQQSCKLVCEDVARQECISPDSASWK